MMTRFRLFRIVLYVVAALPLLYLLLDVTIALDVYRVHGHWPHYGFRGEGFSRRSHLGIRLWEYLALAALIGTAFLILPLGGLSLIGMKRFKKTEPPYGPAWPRALAPVWFGLFVWAVCWIYFLADPFNVLDWIFD